MSYLKDLFSRPAKDEFPTRVQGKTADEWHEVLQDAHRTADAADRHYDRALRQDWEKDQAAYAKHYGYPLEEKPSEQSFEEWRRDKQTQRQERW